MLPNQPTDNLYKFLAITGIALIASSAWLQYSMESEYLEDAAVARGQMIAFASEFENCLNRLARDVTNGDKETKARLSWGVKDGEFELVQPGSSIDILQDSSKRQDYRKGLARFDDFLSSCEYDRYTADDPKAEKWFPLAIVRDLRSQLRTHSVDVEKLWLRQDRTNLLKQANVIGWTMGFALAFAGFFLWYTRVQIHLDAKARKDASKKDE